MVQLCTHTKKTERITRRHTPREVRPFRVYGQPTRNRVHWHVRKSSLPEEENKGDTSETPTHDPMVTSRARYHCATPAAINPIRQRKYDSDVETHMDFLRAVKVLRRSQRTACRSSGTRRTPRSSFARPPWCCRWCGRQLVYTTLTVRKSREMLRVGEGALTELVRHSSVSTTAVWAYRWTSCVR